MSIGDEKDTIAGIATAQGEGGISIVRVSGPAALAIADSVFACHSPPPSRRDGGTFVHGQVTAGDNPPAGGPGATVVDEAVLLIFRAPRSYTREDVVEIQGHGGVVSAQRVLRRVLDAGARLAEPGEFTKRAFINGRIDLTQAEAVLDLIRAGSDRAAAAAIEQLGGALTSWVTTTYDDLLSLVGGLEVGLDFPDDEMPPLLIEESCRMADAVGRQLDRLLGTWDEGHVVRDGVLTVISGKPNVGKSTLFNALLGTDRAIVADHPGTTRDTLEERLIIDGILLRLVDTAGLRDTDCVIEHQGVLRAKQQMQKADLHIHILDASQPLDRTDRESLSLMPPDRTIVVLNKVDLGVTIEPSSIAEYPVISACFLKPGAVDNLKTTLASRIARYSGGPARVTISERHRQAILAASVDTREAMSLLAHGREEAIAPAVSLLRSAAEELAMITGRVYHDDLLDRVFSRFCIGK